MEPHPDPVDRVMALLQTLRTEGKNLRVIDLEPLLPAYGIQPGSRDHFILLMADFEMATDDGAPITLQTLIEDYPRWKSRIETHFQFLEKLAPLAKSWKSAT